MMNRNSGLIYTVLAFLYFLTVSAEAETPGFDSLTIVPQAENGLIEFRTSGEVLFTAQPAFRSNNSYTVPGQIDYSSIPEGAAFSGKIGKTVFSGGIRTGSGLQFFMRYYPPEKAEGTYGILLKGDGFSEIRECTPDCAVGTVRLLTENGAETVGGGVFFIPESQVHITSRPSAYSCFSAVRADAELPVLLSRSVPFEDTVTYRMTEFTCGVLDSIPDPYGYTGIVCEVYSPSGNRKTIHPFFTRDFVQVKGKHQETGAPVFRFRFTPSEPGEYPYTVKAGNRVLDQGRFSCGESDSKGFIRFSGESRYLTYSSGEVFFPVGINLCWSDDMKGYMDILHENGINFMRLWLCTWGFDVEGESVNDYRLDTCSRLDEIFRYARQKNIRIMFCINNFYDFRNNKTVHGYYRDGNLCVTDSDFFVKPEVRSIRSQLFRYLVNRYAAFTSLAMWELWNEVDYAISPDTIDLPASQKQSADVFHFTDPYGRAVTTSLGVFNVNYDLWDLTEMDTIQYHVYIPQYTVIPRGSEYADTSALIQRELKLFAKYSKPLMLSEFGHNGSNEHNPNNEIDPDGVMLHNSLWASALSGWSTTAMHWWWDIYIKENELFYLYEPLANALDEFVFTADTQPFGSENILNNRLRVMGLKNSSSCLLWVQDKQATWEQMQLYHYVPGTITGAKLKIGTFKKGGYTVHWINTFSGKTVMREKLTAQGGYLIVKVPDFTRDTACIITPVQQEREKE